MRRSIQKSAHIVKDYIPHTALVALAIWTAVGIESFRVPVTASLSASVAEAFLPRNEEPVPELTTSEVHHEYIEIIDSCGPGYGGACVNMRSGPSTDAPAIAKLRTGVVLKTGGIVEENGQEWYKIAFDEWLRYPERVEGEHYVSAAHVRPFLDDGTRDYDPSSMPKSKKRIVVDRSDQMLYAYDGNELFMEQPISTGLELTPTPRGQFKVYRKTPSRYMQGPIPEISEKSYDLPGVPWNLYFTYEGAVIHGAYWHDRFGEQWSNGCVNMPPEKAKELYLWTDLGTSILVRD